MTRRYSTSDALRSAEAGSGSRMARMIRRKLVTPTPRLTFQPANQLAYDRTCFHVLSSN